MNLVLVISFYKKSLKSYTLIFTIILNLNMNEIASYMSIVAAILGVGYPIILQNIARLDDKYSSDYIIKIFNQEWEKIWFQRILVLNFIFFVIWSFKFKPIIFFERFDFLIKNSGSILVILLAIMLVGVFLCLIRKIQIYQIPEKIFEHSKNLYSKRNKIDRTNINVNETKIDLFYAISDLFYASIRAKNQKLCISFIRYFDEIFQKESEIGDEEFRFPNAYLELAYFSTKVSISLNEIDRMPAIDFMISSNRWLLNGIKLENKENPTFRNIWENLNLMVKFYRDDMILSNWEKADSFISGYSKFRMSDKKLDLPGKEKFIEFYILFGALLVYKNRFNCLNRILSFTNSEPPQYHLLPTTMDKIFFNYFKFRNENDYSFISISYTYPFSGIEGIKADSVIKLNVSTYLAILFLRQYSLYTYFSYERHLAFPQIPNFQRERKKWIEGLDFFKSLVLKLLDRKDVLEELKLDFISLKWCRISEKLHPKQYFNQLISKVKEEFELGEKFFILSENKKQKFINKSFEKLKSTIENISPLFNQELISENYKSWLVNGIITTYDRNAFIDNAGIDYVDFDTFISSELSRKIYEGIGETFLFNTSKSYLFSPKQMFEAISRLEIPKEELIIISFGIRIEDYIDFHRISNLLENEYYGIPLFSFAGFQGSDPCLFVLRKSDLPNFIFKEPEEETKNKFKLESLGIPDYPNINFSIISLSSEESLKSEIQQNFRGKDLDKSVLLSLVLELEIRWKLDVFLLQLVEYSEYSDKGFANNIDDVDF